jgi:secreted PhoX family phosphatase
MELLHKNGLYKAMLLAMTTSMLIACGSDSDGDDGGAGVSGAPGNIGEQGQAGLDGKDGTDGAIGTDGASGENAPTKGRLTRLATVPTGAEVTGMFMTEGGDLFFNAQHPSSSNTETDNNPRPYNKGTVGVIEGVSFNDVPNDVQEIPVPATDFEKQTIQTAYGQYKILGQNGDQAGQNKLGVIKNFAGDLEVVDTDMPDFNAYLPHPTNANEGYLFTNWEQLPGGMSRMHLKKEDGAWGVLDAMMVDFNGVNGTAANCFGSVSPWGTPLTSEEWVVYSSVNSTTEASWNDPAKANNTGDRIGRMWQLSDDASNPYDFGYIVEIKDPLTTPMPVKQYTIGRYEHENSTVMPDEKTVYSSQDDTGGVLFKFIADTAKDLSVGTLYGAKLTQDVGSNDPAIAGFKVDWVELAHSDNTTIKGWIADFNDIGTDQYVDGETSYMTVADVIAWAAWVEAGRPANTFYPTIANGGGKKTAGLAMDDRAAFLESRQAAKQLGATAEWRKLEGISINAKRVKEAVEGTDEIENERVDVAYMYIGNAETAKTMIDGIGDIQLSDRVNVCGTVYRAQILMDYNINYIEPVINGSTYHSDLGTAKCDENGLTNPDNVIVLDDGRILIGEDGSRPNNTLWMYEPLK